MKNSKNRFYLAALALILTVTISLGSTFAYFTAYDEAEGGSVVNLKHQTTIIEKLDDLNKIIGVENQGTTKVVTRVYIAGETTNDRMKIEYDSKDWTKIGNYYYYNEVLDPGESTKSNITVTVTIPEEDKDKEFDILVSEESSLIEVMDDGRIRATGQGWDEGLYYPLSNGGQ